MMRQRLTMRFVPWTYSHWTSTLLPFCFITLSFLAVEPLSAATPIGVWYAEGGAAQVEIRQCGSTLCGRVVWLRSPFTDTGCALRDQQNPDTALRQRPVLGLDILQGLHPVSDDGSRWEGGTIYDPTSGRTYRCTLQMHGEDRLSLRGYFGIPLLGRTTTWIRVGTEEQQCQ